MTMRPSTKVKIVFINEKGETETLRAIFESMDDAFLNIRVTYYGRYFNGDRKDRGNYTRAMAIGASRVVTVNEDFEGVDSPVRHEWNEE